MSTISRQASFIEPIERPSKNGKSIFYFTLKVLVVLEILNSVTFFSYLAGEVDENRSLNLMTS